FDTLSKQPLSSFTLLYIEDNTNNFFVIKRVLEQISDARVIHAPTAALGLGLATSLKPDIILMDINLPDMNGFDALTRLQNIEETHDIPVIAISAYVTAADVNKGIQAGFCEYLAKPVDFEVFSQTITDIISNKEPVTPT
ncbi:MAG: response regulator, partial [Gammaproteobacteria bacterium]|nr:response regulator [Gammaproteobacteria bacterium]